MDDLISRQTAIDVINQLINEFEEICSHIRERNVDDSVCGLCEYDGAYIGQSGDWCNECPGFDKDDCFKLKDEYRQEWLKKLPSAEPERKTGRWIYDNEAYPYGNPCGHYDCDQCGESVPHKTNFCPNCGAKMEAKHESN